MRRFGIRGLPAILAAAVIAGVLPGVAVASPGGGKAGPPKLQQPKAVPVKEFAAGGKKRPDAAAANSWKRTAAKVRWPGAGSAEVSLAPGGRAGSLPVSITASRVAPKGAALAKGPAKDEAPARVKVALADREDARRAGIKGVLLTVGRTDGVKKSVPAKVEVDYSSFRGAYGGDWAARLRLVQLPACALTTPDVAKCRKQTPVATKNDIRSGKLSAHTMAAPTATVLAATADASGPTGDYKATSLQASGSWSAGGSTGAFTWAHPIGIPTVPGGLEPKVSLGYNSQAVDGRTAASNSQPSWIGDGWSWEPGFIERRYKSCNDDKTGGTNTTKVGDLCWFNDNATLSLNGKNTELVYEAGKAGRPRVTRVRRSRS